MNAEFLKEIAIPGKPSWGDKKAFAACFLGLLNKQKDLGIEMWHMKELSFHTGRRCIVEKRQRRLTEESLTGHERVLGFRLRQE